MPGELVQTAGGFSVGEVLRISCAPESARVVKVLPRYVFLEWPWRRIDQDASRVRWDGSSAFPRDPDHWQWHNTAWRLEPEAGQLEVGQGCLVGIEPVEVRITQIRRHDPPLPIGWLPRPEIALGVAFLGEEDLEEAGFAIYLPSPEPLVIERVGS
jgi:hypothetical protein